MLKHLEVVVVLLVLGGRGGEYFGLGKHLQVVVQLTEPGDRLRRPFETWEFRFHALMLPHVQKLVWVWLLLIEKLIKTLTQIDANDRGLLGFTRPLYSFLVLNVRLLCLNRAFLRRGCRLFGLTVEPHIVNYQRLRGLLRASF